MKSSFAIPLIRALFVIFVCTSCATRASRVVNKAPGSVITETSFSFLLAGGLCHRNASTGAMERCSTNLEDLKSFMPSGFVTESLIKPSAAGDGYIFEVTWKYSPASITNSRTDWKVYEDTSGRPDPKPEELQSRLDYLGRFHSPEPGNNRYLSDVLSAGKRYVLYWSGATLGSQSDKEISAEVYFHRIVIDLRDAVPARRVR